METLSVVQARDPAAIGRQARVQGWIRTRRDSKAGLSFLELNDGSSLASLQVIAEASLENYASEVQRLAAGASVTVEGTIQASQGRGQLTELRAERLEVHGWSDPAEYPLQKKRHSLEKLREWAHLRPRTNTFGAVMRVRNRMSYAIHQFFQERGFLYVHTPIITASDCEGAGHLFRVTTLDLGQLPTAQGRVDFQQDFFHRPTFLTVSGQLEGEIFATSMGRIYTFGPTFRAENSNTSRHLAEFWMVEPEMAFCDLGGNMQLGEEFLKYLFGQVLEHCADDMEFFRERIEPTVVQTLENIVESEFVRLPYGEAIELLAASGERFEFEPKWGADLQSEHERYLTEKKFGRPVIVFNYPATLKPFYMRVNDDGRTVAAMDVLVPRVGEIIGGSQREDRLEVLERRMREQGLDLEAYWWYRDLRRFGTVPHSGFGLGLERAVQFVTGMANIRDVIPFPRVPGNAEF